jgi:P-type conjugative transfer protein TrbJ
VGWVEQLPSLLTGSIGTTIGNLNNPAGYTPQLAAFAANWPQQLTTWNNTVGNAYRNLGQVLQLQSTQQASDLSVLTALQNQNPTGRLQALQIAHELAMAEAKELHEMDLTMTAATQAQQTANAVRAEKEAVEDAAWQRMLQFTPLPVTGQSFSVSPP